MTFNKPAISSHTKPLYLKACVNGKSLDKVLIDNGSIVNVIPLRVLLSLGKTENDIILTNLVVTAKTGDVARTLGVIPLQIIVGSKTSVTVFFVINSIASYKLLLGRDWLMLTYVCRLPYIIFFYS